MTSLRTEPFGLLNLNKPPGMTSRDVVDRVQRLVRPAKAGHAGTLDPLATGVLVVCVGRATRLIEYVQREPKRYVGTFLLGKRSDTEDVEGEVTELSQSPRPSREQIAAAAEELTGEILQRPPAYSALKVQGKRAYQRVRAGQQVELKPRPVRIDRLQIVRFDYPELELEVECGGGTYIRSLGRDLAEAVGTAAVMSALVRTAIGPFRIEDAVAVDALCAERLDAQLLPAKSAVASLPSLTLDADCLRRLAQGQAVELPAEPDGEEAAVLGADGRLAAVIARREDGTWRPLRNFLPPG